MSQTGGYGFKSAIGLAGQIADVGPVKRIDSFAAEEAIGFGLGVTRGTDIDKQCLRIDNSSNVFLGVAVFDHTREQGFDRSASPSSTPATYVEGDAVAVLREGRVYVELAANVLAGASAYVVPASGKWTSSASATVGPVGQFVNSGSTGEIVAVDIVR